eukprot:TRINITY_DN875_c0_g4_i1.p1 TRINITY_DN875_c0_g4~~TRINITY_DN875_c0_g4_i1.p1  ORF type:complete len:214 (+),score=58.26 TRINITY_DN875_c0_g4_i1:45-686(+)
MTVTFTYFPLLARGFAPMLALEEHKVDWKGEAKTKETWPEMKAAGICPFGQLPILETADCGVIAQAGAIAGYVGRVKNAAGKDGREAAVSEMLSGISEDFYNDLNKLQPTVFVASKGTKEEFTAMWSTTFPTRLATLEKFANGKDKFTEAGNTIGELNLFSTLHQMVLCSPTILDASPAVKSFYSRVLALPSTQKIITGKSAFGAVNQYFLTN